MCLPNIQPPLGYEGTENAGRAECMAAVTWRDLGAEPMELELKEVGLPETTAISGKLKKKSGSDVV